MSSITTSTTDICRGLAIPNRVLSSFPIFISAPLFANLVEFLTYTVLSYTV
jgi:hypothetical protein